MMLFPNGELVAKAWILGISGIPANSVASVLPEDRATWTAGFIQATLISGNPEMHVKKRQSVLDIKTWAQPKTPGSDKPRWNLAAQLSELVFNGCYDNNALNIQRLLTLPAAYDDARVLTAIATEPVRRGEDENSNAAFGFELTLNWIAVAATP